MKSHSSAFANPSLLGLRLLLGGCHLGRTYPGTQSFEEEMPASRLHSFQTHGSNMALNRFSPASYKKLDRFIPSNQKVFPSSCQSLGCLKARIYCVQSKARSQSQTQVEQVLNSAAVLIFPRCVACPALETTT